LISGQGELSDYQFGSKQGHHRFCKTCGVSPFGDGDVKEIGGAFVSVNVACLDDISPEELARVPVSYMDGRNDNWFQPPKVTSYLCALKASRFHHTPGARSEGPSLSWTAKSPWRAARSRVSAAETANIRRPAGTGPWRKVSDRRAPGCRRPATRPMARSR